MFLYQLEDFLVTSTILLRNDPHLRHLSEFLFAFFVDGVTKDAHSLEVNLPLGVFRRDMCRLWSKLLCVSFLLAFGHLTLNFQISFSNVPLVGSLLGVSL